MGVVSGRQMICDELADQQREINEGKKLDNRVLRGGSPDTQTAHPDYCEMFYEIY